MENRAEQGHRALVRRSFLAYHGLWFATGSFLLVVWSLFSFLVVCSTLASSSGQCGLVIVTAMKTTTASSFAFKCISFIHTCASRRTFLVSPVVKVNRSSVESRGLPSLFRAIASHVAHVKAGKIQEKATPGMGWRSSAKINIDLQIQTCWWSQCEGSEKTHRLTNKFQLQDTISTNCLLKGNEAVKFRLERRKRTTNDDTYHHTDGIRPTGGLFFLHGIAKNNIHELIIAEQGSLNLSALVQLQLDRLLQIGPV